MIDCSKPVKYKVIRSSSYMVINSSKTLYSNTEEWIPCYVEYLYHSDIYRAKDYMYQFGSVKTDDTAINQDHKLNHEQALYDIIDLDTGYVVAKTFEGKRKQAAKFLSEQKMKHQGNGIYIADTWVAEIHSRKQYIQE